MAIGKMYRTLENVLVRTCLLPTNANPSFENDDLSVAALAIASYSLFERKNGTTESVKLSLAKYRKRMSFRQTPFGLFAGVSLAKFGETTDLSRGAQDLIVTKTRPDMAWLMPFVSELEANKVLRRNLTWFSNSEIFFRNGRVWSESIIDPKSVEPKKVNVKALQSVLRTLVLCSNGATFEFLEHKLSQEFGVDNARAANLLHQLCDLGLLTSSLRFALSDWHLFREDCIRLSVNVDGEVPEKLADIIRAFDAIDEWDGALKSGSSFDKLRQLLSSIVPKEIKDIVQVDASFGLLGLSLSRKVSEQVAIAGELVFKLSTAQCNNPQLKVYRSRFESVYQEGREIPLLELLSDRFGIGSPYIDQEVIPELFVKRDLRLLELLIDSVRSKSYTIDLTDSDIEALSSHSDSHSAPLSLDLFYMVNSESREHIDRGDFRLIVAPRVGEIGAGRSVGRFAHVLGSSATDALVSVANLEQEFHEEVLADVSFWTFGERMSNVAIAPSTRRYCITANCALSMSSQNIPLSEIVIGLEGERFYARWVKDGRRISARSNNLLNLAAMPIPVRFLLDIALDGHRGLRPFDWRYLSTATFLPQIRYQKVILSRARWQLVSLVGYARDDFDLFECKLDSFIKEWKVPSSVEFSADEFDDNFVFLNLNEKADRALLASLLRKKGASPILFEHIPSETWHTTEDGLYATEFVSSLIRSRPERSSRPLSKKQLPSVRPTDRLKNLGSEWVYLKLSSSPEVHSEILLRIASLVRQMRAKGFLENWFFVRYFANDEHEIRLRFQVTPLNVFADVVPAILEWCSVLAEEGLVKRFVFDAYDREVERYGGFAAMLLVESIFTAQSDFALGIHNGEPYGIEDRILAGVVSVNALLKALGYSDAERVRLMKPASRWVDRDELSGQYRKMREKLDWHLGVNPNSSALLFNEKIQHFGADLEIPTNELRILKARKILCNDFDDIAHSLIHMHCNRLFGIDRLTENMVRALLSKALDSIVKRGHQSSYSQLSASGVVTQLY